MKKFTDSASVSYDGLENDDDITLMWSLGVSQERRRWTCNFLRRSLWKMVLNGLRMSDVCFSEVDGTIEISKWAACWFQSRFFAGQFMREPSSIENSFEVQKANIENADDSIICRLLVCNMGLIRNLKNSFQDTLMKVKNAFLLFSGDFRLLPGHGKHPKIIDQDIIYCTCRKSITTVNGPRLKVLNYISVPTHAKLRIRLQSRWNRPLRDKFHSYRKRFSRFSKTHAA